MAVKGSTAKNVGVKKTKPKPSKTKGTTFKYYEPRAQASAAEARVSGRPKDIKGVRNILKNYTPNRKTGRISPSGISRLKQIRANEASEARSIAYRNSPKSKNPKKLESEAAQIARTKRSNQSKTLRSTGERAPENAFGKYRKIHHAALNRKDYRKDFRTVAGTERRNANIHYMRQKSARRKKNG